jgi:hypothetical protein
MGPFQEITEATQLFCYRRETQAPEVDVCQATVSDLPNVFRAYFFFEERLRGLGESWTRPAGRTAESRHARSP